MAIPYRFQVPRRQLFLDNNTGSDSNNGTSWATPIASFAKAELILENDGGTGFPYPEASAIYTQLACIFGTGTHGFEVPTGGAIIGQGLLYPSNNTTVTSVIQLKGNGTLLDTYIRADEYLTGGDGGDTGALTWANAVTAVQIIESAEDVGIYDSRLYAIYRCLGPSSTFNNSRTFTIDNCFFDTQGDAIYTYGGTRGIIKNSRILLRRSAVNATAPLRGLYCTARSNATYPETYIRIEDTVFDLVEAGGSTNRPVQAIVCTGGTVDLRNCWIHPSLSIVQSGTGVILADAATVYNPSKVTGKITGRSLVSYS